MHPDPNPTNTVSTPIETVLAALKCSFPFAGKSAGTGKLTARCPACGASHSKYTYPANSRFKHCFSCGYDRFDQRLLESVRADAKAGRPINPDYAERVVQYYRKVFVRLEGGVTE